MKSAQDDNEHRFKRGYVVGLTLLTLIVGWGGAAVMLGAFPDHYTRWFPYMPAYYYFWGILFISLFRHNMGHKVAVLFLGMKIAKMLLFVLISGLYIVSGGAQKVDFIVTFLCMYLIYLLFETLYFWRYEKKLKLKGEDTQHE